MSVLDILDVGGVIKRTGPAGPTTADDTVAYATGSILDVEPTTGRAYVKLHGGSVWLPAVAGRYTPGTLARILMDTYTGRPTLVLGAVTPRPPAALAGIISGPSAGTLTVQFDGVEHTVPAPTGAYTVGESAWILLDDWGQPLLAIGPSSEVAPGFTPPGAPPPTSTKTVTVSIGPQWSGTYDTDSGRWNNWNPNRYGGPTNVWQGNAYGSGVQRGFVGFGSLVENLAAISISRIRTRIRKNDTNGLSASAAIQPSSAGSRPVGSPPSAGDVVTTPIIAPGGWGELEFTPSMREAFRTGAAKGLVTVGTDYGGFGGTATPGSFVLEITYTTPA